PHGPTDGARPHNPSLRPGPGAVQPDRVSCPPRPGAPAERCGDGASHGATAIGGTFPFPPTPVGARLPDRSVPSGRSPAGRAQWLFDAVAPGLDDADPGVPHPARTDQLAVPKAEATRIPHRPLPGRCPVADLGCDAANEMVETVSLEPNGRR